MKANDTKYVSSVRYTANVLGDEASATGSISFAAIDVDKPTVATATSNLKAGTSASKSGYIGGSSDIAETTNLNDRNAQYILTQQVSSKDIDNSVQFKVEPSILLPAVSDDVKAKDYQQDVNLVSGKYHTYADDSQYFDLNVDTSLLSYASLNFDKLQLSPYTQMDIEYYTTYGAIGSPVSTDTIKADDLEGMEKNNFAVQIPLKTAAIKSIKVILKSAGQVQDNKNDGYSIKDITGVYKDVAGSSYTKEVLKSAKITWNAVDPTYSETKSLSYARATNGSGLGINPEHETDTFTYAVPAFPNTGNAVITEKDKNGKLIAYYLVPTENQSGANKNSNDIKKYPNGNDYKAYKATEEEVSNYIKTGVTQNENGTLVKTDSDKSGITTLKGELKIEGMDELNLLDASNSNFYTSVQWNPIPKETQSTAEAFLAIAGQKVTITGQLVDKNGNAVSLSGQNITFNKSGSPISSNKDVTVVKEAAPTDTNGKSTIVLSAAQAVEFLNVTASCADSKYDVKLSIGNTGVANDADLYWVDADLQFLSSVGEGTYKTTKDGYIINTTSNNTIDVNVKDPTVGTPWEYGVKVVAGQIPETTDKKDYGKLAGYTIDIEGLKIFTDSANSNKGTYAPVKDANGNDVNGKVLGTSEFANNDKVSAKINGNSVTDKVTFKAKKGTEVLTFACVGEGTPNINSKINMNVKWQPKGVSLSIYAPKGTTSNDVYNKLYIKLMDSTGKNPLADKDVEFKSGNAADKLINAKDLADTSTAIDNKITALASAATNSVKVTTDKYGIAEIYVKARDIESNNQSSVITATVADIEQTASTTLNWLYQDKTPAFGVVNAAKTDDKQVTVTFNNDINGDTVKEGNFKLTGEDNSGKDVVYGITSVKASGNTAVLTLNETLPAGKYTVAINNKYSEAGIVYTPSDVVGQLIASGKNDSVDFYSTKNATFDLVFDSDAEKFTIKNVDTPVEVNLDSSSPEKTADFVITVNGVIQDQSTKFVEVSNDAYEFSLSDLKDSDNNEIKLVTDTNIKVYYMGNEEGYTISSNDVASKIFKKVLSDNGSISTAGNAFETTNSADYLTKNGYSLTAKVVTDNGTDSLYTKDDAAKNDNTNLKTILDTTKDIVKGTEITNFTTKSTEPDNGKFVKIAFTIYDKSGNVVSTKTLTLTSNGSGSGYKLEDK